MTKKHHKSVGIKLLFNKLCWVNCLEKYKFRDLLQIIIKITLDG